MFKLNQSNLVLFIHRILDKNMYDIMSYIMNKKTCVQKYLPYRMHMILFTIHLKKHGWYRADSVKSRRNHRLQRKEDNSYNKEKSKSEEKLIFYPEKDRSRNRI